MITDDQLLTNWVQHGDRNAGGELINRHFCRVRRFFATKVDASAVEDLVQRTFAGCIERIGAFRGEGTFSAYIFSIARRQLCRHLRDRTRDTQRFDGSVGASSIRASTRSPSSVVGRSEREDLVLQALRSLPLEGQTVLELHYWEGLSGPEIATVLGVQPGAVRVRLHRARKALQSTLVSLAGRPHSLANVEDAARALGVRI